MGRMSTGAYYYNMAMLATLITLHILEASATGWPHHPCPASRRLSALESPKSPHTSSAHRVKRHLSSTEWVSETTSGSAYLLGNMTALEATLELGSVTFLTSADFNQGTYRIRTPGKYVLSEDIIFHPLPGNNFRPDCPSWTEFTDGPSTEANPTNPGDYCSNPGNHWNFKNTRGPRAHTVVTTRASGQPPPHVQSLQCNTYHVISPPAATARAHCFGMHWRTRARRA